MKTLGVLCGLLICSIQLHTQPLIWSNSGISGGSALFHPSFSPYNSDIIYMASDLTGMFYTMTGGENWDVVPFTELRATTLSKMYFTSHPDTLYTIHNDFRNVQHFVYRSDDGGKSWNPIEVDPAAGETVYLYVDPGHTEKIITSNYESLFYSDDGGASFQEVYKAEDNLYLGGVFWNDKNIYLGSNEGLIQSSDGGKSFQKKSVENLAPGMGILSLAGIETEQGLQLFCTVREKDFMWPGMLPDEGDYYGEQKLISIEQEGSDKFISQNIYSNLTVYEDFPFFVDVSQMMQSQILYSAGAYLNNTGNHIHPQVYKLNSETSSWEISLKTDNNINIATGYMGHEGDFEWNWSENAMGFGFDPNNPDVAIITDFSFAHITRDGGTSWEALYVIPEELNPVGESTPKKKTYRTNGLENTSAWWLTWTSPHDLFAAYTDITAIRSEDGGTSWSFDYEGLDGNIGENYNTIYQVSSSSEGVLYAAASTLHDIYQSTELGDETLDNEENGGAVFKSKDGGRNWILIQDFQKPVVWTALDPDNPNIMYASVVNSKTGGIYKTENLQADSNANWVKLSNPPNTEGHPFNVHVIGGDTLVCTYSARLTEEIRFTQSSGVFYSENGGQRWEDRSLPDMKYWTKDLVIDPHDASKSTWYVGVFDGYSEHPATLNTGGLFRTNNRGKTWQELGDFYRVESVSVHQENPNIMYVTTEQDGLWYTDNLNSDQPDFQLLQEYPFQQPVRVFFNPYNTEEVWVTSFGNGLRKGTDKVSTDSEDLKEREIEVEVFPNPATNQLLINLHHSQKPITIQIFDKLGRQVYLQAGQEQRTSIDLGNFVPGVYFVTIMAGTHRLVKKVVIY